MLVLKKGINLRQLGKYGFVHSDDYDFFVCTPHPTWGGSIWIDKKTRQVELFEDGEFGQDAVEILYDMIIVGLVEKEK